MQDWADASRGSCGPQTLNFAHRGADSQGGVHHLLPVLMLFAIRSL